MNRNDFLKKGFGSLVLAPVLYACKQDEVDSLMESSATTHVDSATTASCTVTNSETAGPFPTKSPASLITNNIVSDRVGTKLSVNITIKNVNNNCAVLSGAIVDIWHCDANGYYSEYGGTGMQKVNYTAVHFLRGRQTTNTSGLASWTSIYPGWYSGRAPHIHVSIYNSAGKSLLITQIAFPEAVSKVVYAQGAYQAHGQADTTNARDNVFGDGVSTELATVTGSVSAGYVLTHTIYVKA